MQKFLVGGLAAVALAVPAVALAQLPAPVVESKGVIRPNNAGTKAKPTPAKFTFKAINRAASQTTVSNIQLDMPVGVRLDGTRLDTCSFATLEAGGPSACKKSSSVGKGLAYASAVNPNASPPDCVANPATPGCFVFDTYFFVGGKRSISVYIDERSSALDKAISGLITNKGRRLKIEIPRELQQPIPGLYSALQQLSGSFQRTKKVGKRTYSFVSTTGCPRGRRWSVRTTFFYVPNPNPPSISRQFDEQKQVCRP